MQQCGLGPFLWSLEEAVLHVLLTAQPLRALVNLSVLFPVQASSP